MLLIKINDNCHEVLFYFNRTPRIIPLILFFLITFYHPLPFLVDDVLSYGTAMYKVLKEIIDRELFQSYDSVLIYYNDVFNSNEAQLNVC